MAETEIHSHDDLPTVSLSNVEIFSTGKWNGDVYNAADLDKMVAAFNELKNNWEPVAKAGHEDGQQNDGATRRLFGAPALGYVESLSRNGEKLMANFKDVPRRFAQLIKAGTYKKISSEIYWNYKNPANGKVYPRVLRAVAFLGAEIPAVTNLREIEALFQVSDDGTLYAYDEDENEYRAYELMEYACTVKQDPNGKYCVYDGDGKKINEYDDEEEAQASCDEMNQKSSYEEEDDDIAEYELDGQVVKAVDHFVKKRGDKWVVVSHHGRVLGTHPSRDKALAQLRAVEVNKKHSDDEELYAAKEGEGHWVTRQGKHILIGGSAPEGKGSKSESSGDRSSAADAEKSKKSGHYGLLTNVMTTRVHDGNVEHLRYKKSGSKDGGGVVLHDHDGMMGNVSAHVGGKELAQHGLTADSLISFLSSKGAKPIAPKKKLEDESEYFRTDAGGTDMTEEEVNALMKKREDELSAKIYKEFEDRVHKAREEGKEEANKENELLREDIRKLQLEKRSERIEHWIKGMKEAGKILPAEESKVRSLRTWLPDDGAELKYFAIKEGQTKEFTSGPAEMFESLFKDRKSLFTNYSHNDNSAEDEGQELPDPSAEVDRRAKVYQEKMSKENKTVSYGDALKYVLRTNAGLAQRYQDRSRPN
jgi:hypothetical protein